MRLMRWRNTLKIADFVVLMSVCTYVRPLASSKRMCALEPTAPDTAPSDTAAPLYYVVLRTGILTGDRKGINYLFNMVE